jgi:hypothetical protein
VNGVTVNVDFGSQMQPLSAISRQMFSVEINASSSSSLRWDSWAAVNLFGLPTWARNSSKLLLSSENNWTDKSPYV